MVSIAPFKAIRYNSKKFSNLSPLVCPPYDVISVPEYRQLLESHPANIVRVELPLAQGREDKYAVSAGYWRKWLNRRILVEDKTPAYYGYEQRFSTGGQIHVRRGFFAAMKLEKPGKGHVRPHERTFPKHKEDRLYLMRATHANISPIFGIFFDRQGQAQELISRRMEAKPLVISRDDKGVTHRLWRWEDREAIKILSGVLKAEDVLIADGHHRYETAWNYAQECASRNRSASAARAWKFVMLFLCPLSDPGLVIQPTHRAVRWNASFEEWKKRIESCCTLRVAPRLDGLYSRLRDPKENGSMAFVLEGGKMFWLKPKPDGNNGMPVVYLHEKILRDIPQERISFGQDARQMVESIQRGEANAVFLLPPPDKDAFARICKAGRLLPQKSTYFYPKLGTGFVMRSLDGEI
jgi:uncharacterized protein (DUF1015 family)